jgi:phosphoribosylglycinamide formyltransferase-1
MNRIVRLVIFASGGGSNAHKLVQYFEHNEHIKIVAFITNKAESGVVRLGEVNQIPTLVVNRKQWNEPEFIMEKLHLVSADFIVLAGFLWLIPSFLITAFPEKIVNIHPSLLPKYGGKGMYGMHVHEAVKEAGETMSGCTIHLVNQEYDKGKILFQAIVPISDNMQASDIAKAVLVLEHQHYGPVIENYLKEKFA